jgi:hypothetical protein
MSFWITVAISESAPGTGGAIAKEVAVAVSNTHAHNGDL